MYLVDGLVLNSGAISDFEIVPEFNADGTPKPMVIVGANGSGKTNILSLITDALSEIAAKHFQDILPPAGLGHQFYKMLGGSSIKMGAQFEIGALHFRHQKLNYFFAEKAGDAAPQVLLARKPTFHGVANWDAKASVKQLVGQDDQIETIFRGGAYVFFPANRYEVPYWLNAGQQNDPETSFDLTIRNELKKPIVVASSFTATKRWIVDVILDQAIDAIQVIQSQDLIDLKTQAAHSLNHFVTLHNLNMVLKLVMQIPKRELSAQDVGWAREKFR